MTDENNNTTPIKNKVGRPRTRPIEDKPKRPRGRPRKEIKDSEIKLDFKRPRGRPRKHPVGYVKPIGDEEKYFKNGRVSVFNEEVHAQHLEDHQLLMQAIHRYFIEMETWNATQTFQSSQRMYYWLMRLLKQVKIRQLQVKQFQNSRDPRFNPDVYRVTKLDALAQAEKEFMNDLDNTLKSLREQAGLRND